MFLEHTEHTLNLAPFVEECLQVVLGKLDNIHIPRLGGINAWYVFLLLASQNRTAEQVAFWTPVQESLKNSTSFGLLFAKPELVAVLLIIRNSWLLALVETPQSGPVGDLIFLDRSREGRGHFWGRFCGWNWGISDCWGRSSTSWYKLGPVTHTNGRIKNSSFSTSEHILLVLACGPNVGTSIKLWTVRRMWIETNSLTSKLTWTWRWKK